MPQLLFTVIIIGIIGILTTSAVNYFDPRLAVATKNSEVFLSGFESLNEGYKDYIERYKVEPESLEDFTPRFAFLPNSPFPNGADAWSYEVRDSDTYLCLSGPATDTITTAANRIKSRYSENRFFISSECGSGQNDFTPGQSQVIALNYFLDKQIPASKASKVFAAPDRSFVIDEDGHVFAAGRNFDAQLGFTSGAISDELLVEGLSYAVTEVSGPELGSFMPLYYEASQDSDVINNMSEAERDDFMLKAGQVQELFDSSLPEIESLMISYFENNSSAFIADPGATPFTLIEGLSGVKKIDGMRLTTFFLKNDGTLLYSGVGDPMGAPDAMIPTQILTGIKDIHSSVDGRSAFAITNAGRLLVTGENGNGSLGIGSLDSSVNGWTDSGLSNVIKVSSRGSFITVALDASGVAHVAGNAFGTGRKSGADAILFEPALEAVVIEGVDGAPDEIIPPPIVSDVLAVGPVITLTVHDPEASFDEIVYLQGAGTSGFVSVPPGERGGSLKAGHQGYLQNVRSELRGGFLYDHDIATYETVIANELYLSGEESMFADPMITIRGVSDSYDLSNGAGHRLIIASDGSVWGIGDNTNAQITPLNDGNPDAFTSDLPLTQIVLPPVFDDQEQP